MTDLKIASYNTEAADNTLKEKLCLIEDIFKVKRVCFGFEIPGHEDIKQPWDTFCRLMDQSIEDLEVELAILSAIMSRRARVMAGYDADDDVN